MHDLTRPAQPGDMFVLLVPSEDELPTLRQRQLALQARFGGRPHEVVHVTCQRFTLPDGRPVEGLIRQFKRRIATCAPFPIVATSLIQYEHAFWGTRILRWLVRVTDELHRFCVLVDETLAAGGATPHYTFSASRAPKHMTALEDVPEADLDGYQPETPYPHHLFTARTAVCSLLKGQGAFEILARWSFGTIPPPP